MMVFHPIELWAAKSPLIDRYPAISPDGRQIAFASDRLGPQEIWILDRATGQQRQLKLPGEDRGSNLSNWSPEQSAASRFRGGGS